MSAPRVRLRGVAKGFGGRAILDGVDLDLAPGRVVVVVGPSGGGKSVLLDLVLGLLRPDAGAVEVEGPVGMVFQDGALFDDLTVEANLAFPHAGPPEAAAAAVQAAARAVGLAPGHLAARPTQLSGGLRKRAAIARALVQAPPVLLYDEPTAGLDAASSARVAEAICAARDAVAGQAALVVTHDYPLAARIADEVRYLDPESHRLVPLMTPDDLAAYGPRVEAVSAIRDALEAHFAAADPPPSEPGTDRTPLTEQLRTLGRNARAALTALGGVRAPAPRAFAARVWDLGVTSAPAIAASGLVLGLVSALQIGQALGVAFDDLDPLPTLLGAVLFHHVGPLYTGLFLAGRVGARVASEVGIKTYLRQADALQTFGVRPEAVWLSPVFFAAVACFPVLAVLLEVCGLLGGFFGYVVLLGQNTAGFGHTVLDEVALGPTLVGLARAAVTGGVVATVAYNAGRGARRGSDAVGRATTRAVVAGLLGAIVVELGFGLLGGLFWSVTPCLLRRLIGGLLLLTGLGLAACKDDPFRLGVVFPEADGLKPGDNVLMRGLQVGQVRDVDLHAEGVVAQLEIDPKYRRHIDGKATFSIDSEKLVTGKKALVITPGDPPGGALKNGAIVQGAATESDPIVRAKRALDDSVDHARDEASTLGRAITAPHTLPPRTAGDTVDLDQPGRFVVRLLKVRVHDLTADGRDWDGPGAGDADLVAQVWVDKRQVLLTNVVEDVHTAEWIDATSQAFDIGPETTVRVKILDRDVGYDDEIGIVELKPTRSDARTGRLFRLAAGRVAELDLKIEVAPPPEATADAGK